MTRTRNNPTERNNYQDKLIALEDAVDLIIQHCTISVPLDDAITQSTKALDCLRNGCAALLITRANALINKGKLTDAIGEALKATECQPRYVQGYLVAGDLYFTQGKIHAAIDIYERGLRTVLPCDWPLLYEKREAAKKRVIRRFDFVETLPVEITCNVFTRLADEDRAAIPQCLYTSKHWFEFMLQKCPEIWKTAIVTTGTFDFPHSSLVRFLPSISNHVQHITFGKVDDHSMEHILSVAENDRFPSITSVEIVNSTSVFRKCMPFVIHLRNNLTSLRLMLMDHSIDFNQETFALNTILLQCRNLEYLSVETRATVTYQPERIPPSGGYRLLELIIITPRIDQSVHDLLRQQFLRLQLIGIYDYSSEAQSHLDLQQPNRWEVKVRNYLALEKPSNLDKSGLRSFHYMANDITVQDLKPYFTMSQKTLETLELYKIPEIGTKTSIFANLGFCRLTKLSLYICEQQITSVAMMLGQCPLLEDVMLFFGGAPVSDRFFSSLATLAHLHDLTLSYFHSSSELLERFFATIASRHQICKLQAITLANCDDVTDEMLNALADMTTLQNITLLFLKGASVGGLAAFIRKLQTLPYLKSVDLHTVSDITDAMIIQLAEIDGLLELSLKGLGDITSNGVKEAADHALTLIRANIHWCQNVDNEATQYLYNKLKCR